MSILSNLEAIDGLQVPSSQEFPWPPAVPISTIDLCICHLCWRAQNATNKLRTMTFLATPLLVRLDILVGQIFNYQPICASSLLVQNLHQISPLSAVKPSICHGQRLHMTCLSWSSARIWAEIPMKPLVIIAQEHFSVKSTYETLIKSHLSKITPPNLSRTSQFFC